MINALHGTFTVRDDGGLLPGASVPPLWENGLVGLAQPSHAYIATGTKWGPIRLTVETHDSPPSLAGEWTDIVEVTFAVVSGEVLVADWNGQPVYELALAPGPVRLRVHTQGRDEGAAVDWEFDDPNPVEEHLLVFFPGEGPTVVHRSEDRFGRGFRDAPP